MIDQSTVLYCENHPQTETSLRCNNCGKLICAKCAVHTPTGYRCQECVRGHQKKFDTAEWFDYPIIFIVVGVLSLIGSFIASFIGFFTILFAPFAAYLIAEIARYIINRRRSKKLFKLAAVSALIFSLPLLIRALLVLIGGFMNLGVILSLVWQVLYTFTVTTAIYYRLKGIQIK